MANFTKQLADQISNQVTQVKSMLEGSQDILTVILEDHKPLKQLIQVMKDSEREFTERRQAFMEFVPLLITHAKAEEKSLYAYMQAQPEFKEMAFEGDTEHSMADQLCEEIKRTVDQDLMSAKIKVLAESVEHHIKEEENDMFPEVRKHTSPEKLEALVQSYNKVQSELIAEGQVDSPSEAELH